MGSFGRKRLWILGIVALLGFYGFAPAVAQDTAPTVGEIVVDGFNCETGELSIHVPVTNLPNLPDSNGPLGFSVVPHYEAGSDTALPTKGFQPEADDAPYTGDVSLSFTVGLVGADSASSDSASGAIQSIDMKVVVVAAAGSDPVDTSSSTYEIDCGTDGEDTSPPESGDDSDDTASEGESNGTGETVQLPSTGTGTVDAEPGATTLAMLMGAATLTLGGTALRLRREA